MLSIIMQHYVDPVYKSSMQLQYTSVAIIIVPVIYLLMITYQFVIYNVFFVSNI